MSFHLFFDVFVASHVIVFCTSTPTNLFYHPLCLD